MNIIKYLKENIDTKNLFIFLVISVLNFSLLYYVTNEAQLGHCYTKECLYKYREPIYIYIGLVALLIAGTVFLYLRYKKEKTISVLFKYTLYSFILLVAMFFSVMQPSAADISRPEQLKYFWQILFSSLLYIYMFMPVVGAFTSILPKSLDPMSNATYDKLFLSYVAVVVMIANYLLFIAYQNFRNL